jgi:hypothetical protein
MEKVDLPDFLIVGAAKSGTTSLYKYLEKNKKIKMSSPKEPKFFSYLANKTQFNGPGDKNVEGKIIKSFTDYTSLFSTPNNNMIKGEASVDYLYYFKDVIPLLKEYLGDPKIIIILRNPVDRAFSAYLQMARANREGNPFEESLKVEDERIKEGYEFIWHYKNLGLYYDQVKGYLANFSQVKIILFEDLKKDAQRVVNETCTFLGVPPMNIDATKVYNKSGMPKDNWKTTLYNSIINSRSLSRRVVQNTLPLSVRRKIGDKIKEKLFDDNLVKPQMREETRQILTEYFKEDVFKLQVLIDRDLSNWTKTHSCVTKNY